MTISAWGIKDKDGLVHSIYSSRGKARAVKTALKLKGSVIPVTIEYT